MGVRGGLVIRERFKLPKFLYERKSEVFEIMKETGEEPNKIISSKGLQQTSDPKELEGIIDKILAENV